MQHWPICGYSDFFMALSHLTELIAYIEVPLTVGWNGWRLLLKDYTSQYQRFRETSEVELVLMKSLQYVGSDYIWDLRCIGRVIRQQQLW